MSRLRALAASCVWAGFVVAGFSLAGCGGGSPADGSNRSDASDVVRGATGKTNETSGTDPLTKPEVVFIRQKPVEGVGQVMAALATGRVVVDDAGCIRLKNRGSYDGDLIVWPPGYSMQTEGVKVHIVKEDGETLARVGDRVELGGGQIPAHPGVREMYEKHLEIPQKCTGPLWIVGQVVSTSR